MGLLKKTLKAFLPYGVVRYIQSSLSHEIKKLSCDIATVDYQIPTLERMLALANITSLKGYQICEIGGSGQFGIAQLLSRLSGNAVAVSSPEPFTHLSDDELKALGVLLERAPFESMGHKEKKFDFIYGCAVLEHIIQIKDFFKSAYDRLNSGGWLLVHGCPTWFSAQGHHTYLEADNIFYSFGDPNCVVKPFSHLYSTKSELNASLISRQIPQEHAKLICDQIYESSHINRLSIAVICQACLQQPWQEFRMYSDIDDISSTDSISLAKVGLSKKDIQRSSVMIVAKKI